MDCLPKLPALNKRRGTDLTEPNESQTSRPESFSGESRQPFDSDDLVSLRNILIVPWKRRGVVAGCVACCVLAAFLLSITMRPKYRATATIELNQQNGGAADMLSNVASMEGDGADEFDIKVQTETAVIKDDSIALAVMSKLGMLHLSEPGWWRAKQGPVVSLDALPADQRESLIAGFEAHLKVEEVKSSRLIAITYTSTDPVLAARVANQVVAEYKSYLLTSNFNSSRDVSQWLSAQLTGLSNQVNQSQQAVEDFERSHNLSSAMPGLAALSGGGASDYGGASGGGGSGGGGTFQVPELGRLAVLNDEVTQAEAVRLADEAIYRMTATQNPDVISSLGTSSLPGVSSSSVITQGGGLGVLNELEEQRASARVAYASAETKYGRRNPKLADLASQLKSIDAQIQDQMEKIKQRAKNDLTLAEENEKSLRAAYDAQKLVTGKMNDDIVQLGVLMEKARSSRQLYDLLYAKLQEANIEAGNNATDVTIADPARTPGRPWMPQPSLFIAVGLFGGLLLGVGLAYLLESQDDTILDIAQAEMVSNLPVLGMIPFHRMSSKSREGNLGGETSSFLLAPESATAEAFRSLRTGLTLSGVGRKLRVLSVTSALPGEGKSYSVYNLGLAFAASGLSVLIIDADLRRPRQHAFFRVAREGGLSDILAGMKTFDEVLAPHPIEQNLTLLSAGSQSPLSAELLGGGELEKVIETAQARFDLVLVDNAPALAVADAIIVGTHCDGVIAVLRAGRTSRKALRRFVQTLARNRIHILGIVIEAINMSAVEYRSVYGYDAQSYYGEK